MRAAYDDVMRDGLKRQRSVQQILGDLFERRGGGEASPLDQLSIGAAKLRWPRS